MDEPYFGKDYEGLLLKIVLWSQRHNKIVELLTRGEIEEAVRWKIIL